MRAFHRGYLANWPISYAMRQTPERDNNNRQEDHQNCAHDTSSWNFQFVGIGRH